MRMKEKHTGIENGAADADGPCSLADCRLHQKHRRELRVDVSPFSLGQAGSRSGGRALNFHASCVVWRGILGTLFPFRVSDGWRRFLPRK